MAQGDLLLFNEYSKQLLEGDHDLAGSGSVIKVALIDALPTVSENLPTLASFTEVTGSGYTAGGEDIQPGQSVSVVSASTYKYDSSSNPSWTQNGSGPNDVKAALLYNSSVSDIAFAFIDMTVDGGTTPISLIAGNISITWNASGILQIT